MKSPSTLWFLISLFSLSSPCTCTLAHPETPTTTNGELSFESLHECSYNFEVLPTNYISYFINTSHSSDYLILP